MSISPLTYATPSLVDYLSGDASSQDTNEIGAENTAIRNATAQAKKAKSTYQSGGAGSVLGQAALKQAISEMQGTYEGKLTFDKIATYKKDLEDQFSAVVRVELAQRGVDPATEFTLNMDKNGLIEVHCDDPAAKRNIQDYLEKNPKVCGQFGYIQALANLDRAVQSPAGASWQNLREIKAELQASALDSFFGASLQSTMSYAGVTAAFSGEDTPASFYAGISYKV